MKVEMADALAPHRIEALSPQLRRAARFIADNPEEIATRSLRHVAEIAKLPPPTFSRLARAIGYESYEALKERCRASLIGRRGDYPAAIGAPGVDAGGASILARHAASCMEGVTALLRDIDEAELEAAARLLARARRVVLIGEMRARAFVDYASYLSDMSMDGWGVIGHAAVSLAAETRDLGPEDAALVLTMSPYATRSIETARLIAETGAPLIAITDSRLAPVAGISRHALVVSERSPLFFPSYVVATLVIEALIGMVVREKGDGAQRRIVETARRCRDLNEYWRD